MTREKRARQIAELMYFNEWAGFRVGMKFVNVRTKPYPLPVRIASGMVVLDPARVLDEAWLGHARRTLSRRPAKHLVGYASAIAAVAEYCVSMGDAPERFSLESVILGGETIPDSWRDAIVRAWGCRPLSRYATEEFGVLGHEHPDDPNRHVLNTASYVVELLALDSDEPVPAGVPGRIVVTDLHSHGLPLIRCDTGDVGVLGEDLHGRGELPILDKLVGRTTEAIYTPAGEPISSAAVNKALWDIKRLVQFQFVQHTADSYSLRLHVLEGFHQEKLIRSRFHSILGESVGIRIDYVAHIPPLPSGKRPYIVNET
jgi:phenylacetate-CoA ligase